MLNLSKRRLSIGLKRHLLDTHKKNISTFHEVSILLFLKKLLFILRRLRKAVGLSHYILRPLNIFGILGLGMHTR